MQRLLLVSTANSYRITDFLRAARRLDVAVTIGSAAATPLADVDPSSAISLPAAPLGEGVARIVEFARGYPLSAIVATDDHVTELAAASARALGLAHNDTDAAATAADKHRMRCALARASLPVPRFALLDLDRDRAGAARTVTYPCVIKPLHLSGSRGVIRANDAPQLLEAAARIEFILESDPLTTGRRQRRTLLVEDYLPGREVCLDGLLDGGVLTPLVVFDKPAASRGPFFEETVLVTPSRLGEAERSALVDHVERGAAAIGLRHGPIHAEARLNDDGVWLLEVAGRSIGGLCSRAVRFTADVSLEELTLRHALGRGRHNFTLSDEAAGVMMIPIPRSGRLQGITGLEAARATAGVTELVLSVAPGEDIAALPEGNRYLGFIFARERSRERVEEALRIAHARLHLRIDPGG